MVVGKSVELRLPVMYKAPRLSTAIEDGNSSPEPPKYVEKRISPYASNFVMKMSLVALAETIANPLEAEIELMYGIYPFHKAAPCKVCETA